LTLNNNQSAYLQNQMKNEKFHTIRAVPKSNLKFVETEKQIIH